MPILERSRIDALVISCPLNRILPPVIFSSPVSPCTNSLCPFPSIPAIQTISPRRTLKEISFTALLECALLGTVICSTFSTVSPGFAGFLSTEKFTFLPTIILESSSFVVSFTFTVPTYLPLRRIVQRSATSIISFSLCVMNRMDLPSFARFFIIFISSSISCGVRTAVGSSKIRTSLSRYNIFRISVLCCIPTVISETRASGSTISPYLSLSSITFWRAPFFSRNIPFVGSTPRIILSNTEKHSTSLKCWCTIPIFKSFASFGVLICTSLPSFLIVPEVG